MALHYTYTIDPRSTFLTTLSLFKYLTFTNTYNNYTNVTRYQKLCAISFQLVDHRGAVTSIHRYILVLTRSSTIPFGTQPRGVKKKEIRELNAMANYKSS